MWFREKPTFDEALNAMLQTTEKIADDFIANAASSDRAVTTDELRRVETFFADHLLMNMRAATRQSYPGIEIIFPAIEPKLRKAFAARLYAKAPLEGMANEGQA